MAAVARKEVGSKIARLRKLRRLTQRQLANRANISVSLLSKVEAGFKPATPMLITAIAPVLGVSASELYGQPYPEPGRPNRVHAAIPALHGALSYSDISIERDVPHRSYQELVTETERVNRLRQAGNYTALGDRLPYLIEELSAAVHTAAGPARERYARLLALVYFAAHSLAYKLGYDQLATIAEDRMVWAAAASSDPLLGAVAAWTRCTSLMATAAATNGAGYTAGLRLLAETRQGLEPGLTSPSCELLCVYGGLHLREGVISARSGKAADAWEHIAAAKKLVRRGAADHNPASQLTCGPVNAGIVEVAVAVDLGDNGQAIRRARDLVIPRDFPAVRASQHFIDLARAHLWEGARGDALDALLRAERYAPQQTRHHPTTHETLAVLVKLERRCSDRLLGLVNRISQAGAARLLPSPRRIVKGSPLHVR